MKIDLHVHTNSFDTSPHMSPEKLVERGRARGLDGIASTNHDSVEASREYVEYGRVVGFPIFLGVEVSTDRGHLLVYGLEDDAWKDWSAVPSGLPSAVDFIEHLDRDRVAVILAHPFFDSFYPTAESLYRFLPYVDGVESLNGGKPYVNKMLRDMVGEGSYVGIGGSDAHELRNVGDAYTEFDDQIHDGQDLVRALKGGRFAAVMNRKVHRFFR